MTYRGGVGLNETELLQMAYAFYSAETVRRNAFDNKAAFIVGGLTLLGGAAVALASQQELLVLELVILGIFWLLVVASAYQVMRIIIPPQYMDVVSLRLHLEWRNKYSRKIASAGFSEEESKLRATRMMTAGLIDRLAESSDFNDYVNQHRQKHYRRSVYLMVTASIALLFGAIFIQARSIVMSEDKQEATTEAKSEAAPKDEKKQPPPDEPVPENVIRASRDDLPPKKKEKKE